MYWLIATFTLVPPLSFTVRGDSSITPKTISSTSLLELNNAADSNGNQLILSFSNRSKQYHCCHDKIVEAIKNKHYEWKWIVFKMPNTTQCNASLLTLLKHVLGDTSIHFWGVIVFCSALVVGYSIWLQQQYYSRPNSKGFRGSLNRPTLVGIEKILIKRCCRCCRLSLAVTINHQCEIARPRRCHPAKRITFHWILLKLFSPRKVKLS